MQVSDADIAIAGDDDIEGILGVRLYLSRLCCDSPCMSQAEDWPVDFATYLRRVQPPVDVEERCQYLIKALQ